MKPLLVFVLLIGIALANNSRVSYEGYKLYSVSPKSIQQIQVLQSWQDVNGIDFLNNLNAVGKPVQVLVAPVSQQVFETFLDETYINHELLEDNFETVLETERQEQEKGRARVMVEDSEGRATLDFNHFWSTSEIDSFLDRLVLLYGDIMSYEYIGSSVQGQLLRAVKISLHGQVDGSRPIIFIDIGTHAREWASFMTGIRLIHELVEHYYENYDILNNVDWIIIPNVNPDGYDYTHSTDRMWRKNRRVNSNAACPGVDLNRNYAKEWRSSTNQCSEIYPGTGPFSEPETQAVRSVHQRYGSAIALYASVHSFGDYVLYPWGFDFINIANYQEHHALGDRFADAVVAAGGNRFTVGNGAILLYPAYGASDDYMADVGIPLSFTLELTAGPGSNGFILPVNMINPITLQTWHGVRQFGLYVAGNAKK